MAEINHYSTVAALFRQVGNDVIITTGENSSIRLSGVDMSDLDSGDFIF
jgi:hypothetical protein